ncbi:MAG TPA: flavin reductase family protein [Burkholderiaceae bacterium]|nr:flavin reductase family protein [Burkholderiaceae bacterium]
MYSWTYITGDIPLSVDASRFRRALGSFPTGVCLVTTVGADGKREGMTINSFASVSLTPPLVLWSIRDDTRSAEAFLTNGSYIISILASDQKEMALHFAQPALDKFASHEEAFTVGIGGCPKLRHSAATFECASYSRYQEGDHTILVGRVDAFSSSDATPLLFHSGQMGSVWDLAEMIPHPA